VDVEFQFYVFLIFMSSSEPVHRSRRYDDDDDDELANCKSCYLLGNFCDVVMSEDSKLLTQNDKKAPLDNNFNFIANQRLLQAQFNFCITEMVRHYTHLNSIPHRLPSYSNIFYI